MTRLGNKFLGAMLLIIGTCLGAGMLALPVSTAEYGLIPSLFLFFACWAVMSYTGLLILEVTHWCDKDANIITMAEKTLGKAGQIFAWISYLMLLYCLMAAYLSGMNALLVSYIQNMFHQHIATWMGSVGLVLLFGMIIYLGPKPIDYINRILFAGLIVSFFALAILISPEITTAQLLPRNFHHAWAALPIIITAFGFHIIIPSVRTYLNDDVKRLRLAILFGALIAMVVYTLWEILVLGTIPLAGEHGLRMMLQHGQPTVDLTSALHAKTGSTWVDDISKTLALSLISTSFIGVSFSLFDFLADGFHIKKNKLGRLSTALITFVPPLIFMLVYPGGFILALGYGGIFVAALLIILPALMVWSGRYKHNLHSDYRAPGGKIALACTIIFALIIITAELI